MYLLKDCDNIIKIHGYTEFIEKIDIIMNYADNGSPYHYMYEKN
jgi:hypothetical protein